VKLAAVAFALLSVICFVWAASDWGSLRRESPADPDERSPFRGRLTLLVVCLLLVGALWGLAESFGWSRDRALWAGLGGFLALMTLSRPWWFWEDYRARWLRKLIGDEPTAALYLLLAGAMVWIGLFTEWRFGRR
jgi:hypothetical protein